MSATTVRSNGRPRVLPPAEEIELPKGSALMAALLAVQAEAPKLGPNADGQVQGRNYRYVTLDAVVDAVLPLLFEHDLVWATFPTSDDGRPALRYRLTHVPSGEHEEDTMPLMCAKSDPQGQGSALTYARRYALVAVLNLTTGEDDDGAAASGGNAAGIPAVARPPAPDRLASPAQRGMLTGKAASVPMEPEDFANLILGVAGEPPRVYRDENVAPRLLKLLLEKLPAKHVDGVLAGIAAAQFQADGGQSID